MHEQHDLRNLSIREQTKALIKTMKEHHASLLFMTLNGISFCIYDVPALKYTFLANVPVLKNIKMHCVFQVDENELPISGRKKYLTYRKLASAMITVVKFEKEHINNQE